MRWKKVSFPRKPVLSQVFADSNTAQSEPSKVSHTSHTHSLSIFVICLSNNEPYKEPSVK